jgi:hypothetical protein
LAITAANFQAGHERKHEFSVKQYDDFHEVLHPLQHDALPGKNFRAIRGKATLLLKRGTAIVKLGVPRGVSDANKSEFATELNKFRKAIARLRSDARKGTDAQLQASFSAVHDSFEMLVAMLPRE